MPPRKKIEQPPTGQPTIEIRNVETATLLTDPGNARMHNRRNIEAIQASLRRFGQRKPLIIDRKNVVVAGNGTLEAMIAEGWEWCDVAVYPGTASEARAYAIADNRTAELAHWDDAVLLETLQSLPGTLTAATGFESEDIESLLETLKGDPEDAPVDEAIPGKGELLSLAASTVGEPDFETHRGQVWLMGETHILAVVDVHSEWQAWTPLLPEGGLFWPYPSLLAPFTEAAAERPILFVQPNLYLAGWLLTKWQRITGIPPVLDAQ